MVEDFEYLMENEEESIRLETKTDERVVATQAIWGGLTAGMRVADIGCGSGKTTAKLKELVGEDGSVIGVDIAEQRIDFATRNYLGEGISFLCRDAREPLADLGKFDFVWVRFLLEYYREGSWEMLQNLDTILQPGGILCLVDLDHNCLNQYGISEKMEKSILGAMQVLERKANFDPYAGRKLYSYMYDLGYEEIRVDVNGHHVIYGEVRDSDAFNWLKKVEVVPRKIGYKFPEYQGGYDEFMEEFRSTIVNPRRFIYSPIILCAGKKPRI